MDRKRKVVVWVVAIVMAVLLLIGIGVAIFFITRGDDASPSVPTLQEQLCSTDFVCPKSSSAVPPTLLISLDGFRADYLQRRLTPTLQAMKNCGVHVPYIYPSFPSKTFPNHYTIVTGLYPESHGIIDNNMFDSSIKPAKDSTFSGSSTKNPAWYFGEPIWNTVVKRGKKAGVMYWLGSEAKIGGIHPTYWYPYENKTSFAGRVDRMVEWLTLDDATQRPDLIAVYFDEPDKPAHQFGPDSVQVNKSLAVMDNLVKTLFNKLSAAKLLNCINIIIMADHGMQHLEPNEERLIQFDTIIPVKDLIVFGGAMGRIVRNSTTSPTAEDIQQSLNCVTNVKGSFVRTSKEMPRRLHYATSTRIGDVVVALKPGYLCARENDTYYLWGHGDHGYDYLTPTMRALFLAHGPAFKRNVTGEPFQNVEVNYLLHDLLQLKVETSNNGTYGSLHYLLKNPPKRYNASSSVSPNTCNTEEEFKNTTMAMLLKQWSLWASKQPNSSFANISGTIFDYNNDGIADTHVENNRPPTHFYLVLFWRQGSMKMRSLSFVLPNEHKSSLCTNENATTMDDYYYMHSARLRDVELLTRMTFTECFPGAPLTEEQSLAMRIHISDKLWWRN